MGKNKRGVGVPKMICIFPMKWEIVGHLLGNRKEEVFLRVFLVLLKGVMCVWVFKKFFKLILEQLRRKERERDLFCMYNACSL